MPELPEVQTVVSDLKPVVEGLRFDAIESEVENCVVGDFDDLVGRKVVEVARRGKYINIFCERDFVVTVHLRMTGRLLVRELKDEILRFERTRLNFENCSLRFCDQRKFGRVWLNKIDDYERITGQWKLGVEPLSEEFSVEKLIELAKGRRVSLKRFLLDQNAIAGIGNIYADESCFYAGLRPDRSLESLAQGDFERVHTGIIKSLKQGIENRGTSISDYQDAYGKAGMNQEVLFVYGRGGESCLRCGEVLVKVREAGRGTVFCEGCQN